MLASNRGALPETLGLKKGGQAPQADGSSDASNAGPRSQSPFFQGDGGMLFDIPSRYTPDTRIVPTVEEVEPWVETILRLWDDEAFYRQQSEKALARAAQWRPDRLRRLYVEFFRNVYPQPGPPVVPRTPEGGTALSVGQVANLPDTRQIGNLPHDVRGTSLSEGFASVRLDASGNAVDSSDATGWPGRPSRSLLHSEPRAPSSVPTFPFAPSTDDGSAVAGERGKERGRGPALGSEERNIPPGKPAALTGSAVAGPWGKGGTGPALSSEERNFPPGKPAALKGIFTAICRTHAWGSVETPCGLGSTVEATGATRQWLADVCRRRGIRTMVDLGCGDWNWMRLVVAELGLDWYRGYDVVEELVEENRRRYGSATIVFEAADVTAIAVPHADLVLSRDCLMHLCDARVRQAFRAIRASGDRYFVSTTHPCDRNYDICDGGWRPINLTAAPFSLPPPEESVLEFMPPGYPEKRSALFEVARWVEHGYGPK